MLHTMTLERYPNLDMAAETVRWNQDQPQSAGDTRSDFDRDRSRIVHSQAFRRLQGKTQIFAPGGIDYLRTRVTHSIEVAQIGRSFAVNWGIPESLVEAACLAHDLGHPPFGHTGEHALNLKMLNWGGYEGNAQTLHILVALEQKSDRYDGVNLCRATLQGVLKYPCRRTPGQEKFVYDFEADQYGEWFAEGGTPFVGPGQKKSRSIVCEIMDWADDIAYSTHDLEDGLISGFINRLHFAEPAAHRVAFESLGRRGISIAHLATHELVESTLRRFFDDLGKWDTFNDAGRVKQAVRNWIDRFVMGTTIRPKSGSKDDVRKFADLELVVDDELRLQCEI